MELSERKQKILQAVIDEYIGTAEPVGSRAISKNNELVLSSATIRNEMADLEEMGFLIQPHTSAGRVPSDVGYRFYVNSLMRRYQMSVEALEKMQAIMADRVNQLEMIIKKASLMASTLTEYTTVVTSPKLTSARIKKIEPNATPKYANKNRYSKPKSIGFKAVERFVFFDLKMPE